jgi:hypothetical protein
MEGQKEGLGSEGTKIWSLGKSSWEISGILRKFLGVPEADVAPSLATEIE